MSNTSDPERVYLDAVSAAPLHPAAREVLLAAYERGFADPRRLHSPAREARMLLDNARAVTAEALGVHEGEVHFCASGTDAVHRGLLGLLAERSGSAGSGEPRLIHTAVEHSAVLHAALWHASRRISCDREAPFAASASVEVDRVGRVDQAALQAHLQDGGAGAVVACQSANPEVGTRQPVDELDLPEGTALFCDAAASMGHEPLPRRPDVLAGSAHKWGGPPGVGVMVIRRGTRWRNPFPGDLGHDVSAGFPNIPAALAAAAALRAMTDQMQAHDRQRRELTARIRAAAGAIDDVEVAGDPDDRLPHVVTFSCLYLNGEQLTRQLDARGFGVASGSACTASTLEPSHVLAAMGALTHGNVRVSIGVEVTEADVERFCAQLPEVVSRARAELNL